MKTLTAVFMLAFAIGSASASAKVQGLYGTDCLKVEGLSAYKDLVFDIDEFKQVQTVYADSDCQATAYDFTFTGPYSLDETTGFLNYSLHSVKLKPLDSGVAANFNHNILCGIGTWKAGISQEIAGLDCGGQKIPSIGVVVYDLNQDSQSGIRMSLASDQLDGSSEEKRPQVIDELVYFAK